MLKPETVEKLTKYFEIDTDETAEKFLTEFPAKFFPKDKAHEDKDIRSKATAQRMSELTSKLLDVYKTVDPAVSLRDLDKLQVEEIIENIKGKFSTKLTDYETKLKDGSDKRVNDLTIQITDKDKTITSYKEANDKLSGEYEAFKTQKETDIKSYKINHQKEAVKNKIQWIDDLTDVDREGFEGVLNKKYVFDVDEQDNLIVKDKDGKLIPSKKNAGKFAEPLDIMDEIAEANKLKKKNNAQQSNKNINFDFNNIRKDAADQSLKTKNLSPEYLERKAKAAK